MARRRQPLAFVKMQGSGNDFLVIDNRAGMVQKRSAFARRHCPRGSAVGADGVLFLERSRRADLRLRIINADGSEAEMCGNGARCMVRFAVEQCGFAQKLTMDTPAGIVGGLYRRGRVRVELTPPRSLETGITLHEIPGYDGPVAVHFIDTGVPHAVVFIRDVAAAPVTAAGAALRHHRRFTPAGVNADFVQLLGNNHIRVRTYERGVEAETLACGTGMTASALVAAALFDFTSPVTVQPRGGDEAVVAFVANGDGFCDVTLEGKARYVYRGELL